MKKLFNDADAVIIVNPSNLFYFTGYANADAVVVLMPDKRYYIGDKRVLEEVRQLLDGYQTIDCGNSSYIEAAIEIIAQQDTKVLGYEDQTISYRDYLAVSKSPLRLVGVSESIDNLRAVKSKQECKIIQSAQAVTDSVFSFALSQIHEGITEQELCWAMNSNIYSRGCTLAFDTIVAFGANTSKPHAHPTDKKLQKGDPITLDFGAKKDGYCSDMTRSFCFGKPADEYKKIYGIVLEAQTAALDKLAGGVMGDVGDAYARDIFRAYGLDMYFTHSLGHSLGIDIHENPRLSAKWAKPIPAGAVLSVEPGLYFAGKFGVRIEDIVYFENNGIYNLTNSPKKLIIV